MIKKWYSSIVSTKDICIGDVTQFKTVEYWENKINQTPVTKHHKDNLPLVLWEPEPVHTISTHGKIKKRKPAISYKTEKVYYTNKFGFEGFYLRAKNNKFNKQTSK